jgi:Ring finger domain
LQYQLASLSEELELIFSNAPVTRAPDLIDHEASAPSTGGAIRKPVEGECPICVCDMEPDEELVWCKAACGQNYHKDCFERWRQSKMGGPVTCAYCRTEWQDEGTQQRTALEKLKEGAPKIGSYKNIGHLSMYQKPKA